MQNDLLTSAGPQQSKDSSNKEPQVTPLGKVSQEHRCYFNIWGEIWMLPVCHPGTTIRECQKSAQIMDEGETGRRGSLNINVVEPQSISTLTQR